jgi:hypothetical protein
MRFIQLLLIGVVLASWDYYLISQWGFIMGNPGSGISGIGILYLISFGFSLVYAVKLVFTIANYLFRDDDNERTIRR